MDPLAFAFLIALQFVPPRTEEMDLDAPVKASMVDLESPYLHAQVLAAMAAPYKYGVTQMPCKAKDLAAGARVASRARAERKDPMGARSGHESVLERDLWNLPHPVAARARGARYRREDRARMRMQWMAAVTLMRAHARSTMLMSIAANLSIGCSRLPGMSRENVTHEPTD